MDIDKDKIIIDISHRSPEIDPTKVLKFHSDYKGQFVVFDSAGEQIAKGFERPGTTCYVSARTHGSNDSFGAETETLDMAKERIRNFFRKNGYTFEE